MTPDCLFRGGHTDNSPGSRGSATDYHLVITYWIFSSLGDDINTKYHWLMTPLTLIVVGEWLEADGLLILASPRIKQINILTCSSHVVISLFYSVL